MHYDYKRKLYFEICDDLKAQNNVFLLGPRKCGKTVCLHQVKDTFNYAKYFDLKTLSATQITQLFMSIQESIENNEEILYLLDEITYAEFPEREINAIAMCFSEYNNSKTKIVYTGSQSVALEAWASRAFCGNAVLIYADFLQYDEWLEYKGIDTVSADTYSSFLYDVRDFYHLHSLREYLQGCLEETIISNMKTDNIVLGNDCSLLDVDTLLDVCYATLFSLHNHVNNSSKFFQKNKLITDIAYYFRNVCEKLDNTEIANRVENSFIGHYNSLQSRETAVLKQAFWFLYRIGLITITPISSDLENVPNILADLLNEDSRINYKKELFSTYNMCIKYPMFYVAILQEILAEDMPEKLPAPLLGSIVECHVRGLLTSSRAFEFKKIEQNDVQQAKLHEIDYVDLIKSIALEISISNKRSNEYNFNLLPDYFTCIILTRDESKHYSNHIKVPYYKFIHDVSAFKDPIKVWTLSSSTETPCKILI